MGGELAAHQGTSCVSAALRVGRLEKGQESEVKARCMLTHHLLLTRSFGFVLDLPKWLPPSQDNEPVYSGYEVLATCKEASQSWVRDASMQSARRPVQIAIK